MDQLDARLRERLHVLADAVPVSAEPVATIGRSVSTTRSRVEGMSPLASAAALVVIAVIGLALADRATSPTTGASPLPVASPSPDVTASGLAQSSGPSPEASGSPSNGATPQAAVRSSTYPDECPAYGLSPKRCAYIVDWALREAGVAAHEATVELLGDPGCDGNGGSCVRTTMFIVRVRVTPGNGPASDHSVFCGVGGERSLLCTETPRIALLSPTTNGYHDLPCGEDGAPEHCASPVPSIAPSAAQMAVPLRVPSLTIPIDHTGRYVVDVGNAVLPNGILGEATATLPDDVRTDMLIPEWIWLEVIGEDGLPLRNIYEHGWRTGTERVHVRLVFTVDSFEPGASLEITNVVVR
jgi:hypothetical protein